MSVADSGAGGAAHHHHLRNAAAAILLASVASPTQAAAAAAAAAQSDLEDPNRPIIVTAPLFRDVRPERDLDEDAIESYGVSTIDELLGEVEVELGNEADQPLILVNGKRINDLDEIGALPIETLNNVQVLPRGSAVRVGGTSGQRVISITLHRRTRTATLTAAEKVATDGDWDGQRGEGILTSVKGDTRANLTLRGKDESRLFESERNIIQPDPRLPFALGGNVIAFPTNLAGEIDPLLSAAAGQIVTVTPIPAGASPALAAFAANANQAATTDLGDFRTLRPHTRNYDLNGTYATRLAPWLTSSATFRLSRNTSRSLRGLPSVLLRLGDANPASPFSRDVGLAYYGANALHSRSRSDNGEANLTLNGDFGAWTGNFNAKHNASKNASQYERQDTSGTVLLDNAVNPFATDVTDLIGIRTDRSSSRSHTDLTQLSMTGPAVALPAGPVIATVEGQLAWNRLRSESSFGLGTTRTTRRSEQAIRGALDVPLTSRKNNVVPQIGDLSATAELARVHYSDAGTLHNESFGVTWEPIQALRLRGSIEQTQLPAPVSILGDPVIFLPDVRTFDPLTGETVDVTEISGGNPGLKPQKTKIKRLTGILRVLPRLNLQLNAEYTDTDRRNFVSSLPDQSAAIMLAFPERFVRDGSGTLTSIDLRPVNFDSDREKRLRWGFSMNRRFGTSTPAVRSPKGKSRAQAKRPSTYLQLTANHTMVFSEKIVIRSGLDPVNLLRGGAIGVGGGRVRHQVDGTAAITSGGTGARIGVTWRGKSSLNTQIAGTSDTLRFSPLFLLNLRAFTDMRRVLPHSEWAKGMRLSLDVLNLTNERQRVRDSFGVTPLQYQPGYRDALGRTIEIELRKVF